MNSSAEDSKEKGNLLITGRNHVQNKRNRPLHPNQGMWARCPKCDKEGRRLYKRRSGTLNVLYLSYVHREKIGERRRPGSGRIDNLYRYCHIGRTLSYEEAINGIKQKVEKQPRKPNLPAEDSDLIGDTEYESTEDKSSSSSSVTICTVPSAIRMDSGHLEIKGGMICGISDKVEKMIVSVFFKCGQKQCRTINQIRSYPRPMFAYEVPSRSSKPLECVKCGQECLREYDYDVINALRIELQDLDTFSDLERLSVILFGGHTNNVSTGEQVVVIGSIHNIRKSSRLLPFLFASTIRYENRKELTMTSRDIKKIKRLVSGNGRGNIIELLVSKFAPSVIDYEHVKKGLLLCAANTGEDSVSKRLRINALLVGETGLDKSALLRAAA
jgi:hypothetical protein